jgi:hypothetical protein
MVNAIWKNAEFKLSPQPMGPPHYNYDSTMMSTERFKIHNDWIQKNLKTRGGKPGMLLAGHKKDVVISLAVQAPQNEKVAIYGWHQLNGDPIQGPGIQASAHGITYRDYAHGIRLVSRIMHKGENELYVPSVLTDPTDFRLLSDEVDKLSYKYVPFKNPRYVTNK